MEQIVYTSTASEGVSAAEVFAIIASSARNNPQRDVTGFLVFAGDAFLQFVEGPSAQLDELLGVLKRDPRHRDIAILSRSAVSARTFPGWRMHRFDAASGNAAPIVEALRTHPVGRGVLLQVERFLDRPRRAA